MGQPAARLTIEQTHNMADDLMKTALATWAAEDIPARLLAALMDYEDEVNLAGLAPERSCMIGGVLVSQCYC